MGGEIPFIKLLRTVEKYYFLDVNSNSIVRVNEEVYCRLQQLLENRKNINKNQEIEKLFARGYLKPNNENIEIKHPALDDVDPFSYLSMQMICLNLPLLGCCFGVSSDNEIDNFVTPCEYKNGVKASFA